MDGINEKTNMNSGDDEFFRWLVETRRDFHRHPELSMLEKRTTQRIAEYLEAFGWEVTTFEDMPGVLGLLRGKEPGPTLALRADMDALPLEEQTGADYASEVPGVMHACGHDAHATILLGVAKKLAESDVMNHAGGAVRLIFQPAEETLQGARRLIARGALQSPPVDRIYALHLGPHIPAGKIGLYGSLAYAATDTFGLTLTGRGTHGARPDEGRDPITAGAYFITAVQTIVSRNVKPLHSAVVSVGRLQAGRAPNIIPESLTLEGTLRALNPDVRETLVNRLKEMAEGIAGAFQVTPTFELHSGCPPIKNDPDAANLLRSAAEKAFGKENIIEEPPTMGGEDFAFYGEKCPAAIARLGCGNPEKGLTHPLHSPRFDLDERALLYGVNLFLKLIRDFFQPA